LLQKIQTFKSVNQTHGPYLASFRASFLSFKNYYEMNLAFVSFLSNNNCSFVATHFKYYS